jgi:hypothetical protein
MAGRESLVRTALEAPEEVCQSRMDPQRLLFTRILCARQVYGVAPSPRLLTALVEYGLTEITPQPGGFRAPRVTEARQDRRTTCNTPGIAMVRPLAATIDVG